MIELWQKQYKYETAETGLEIVCVIVILDLPLINSKQNAVVFMVLISRMNERQRGFLVFAPKFSLRRT